MINIVIIGQNEGNSIISMRNSLIKYPYRRIWVLDRCTDDSEDQLQELGENYVKTPEEWQGRKTSSARNLGLSMCDPTSDVLFLDGDRFPTTGDLKILENWDKDIALLLCESDLRGEKVINNYQEYYKTINNGFYSCGVFFKRSAIDRKLKYYGYLFPEHLEQWWGAEDVGCGDECYRIGLTCNILTDIKLNGVMEHKEVCQDAQKARLDNLMRIWEMRI